MEQPPRAAAVTTAEARVLESEDERLTVILLKE
jgi:hypothetical protein